MFCTTNKKPLSFLEGPSLVLELQNGIKIYQGNKYDAMNVSKLANLGVKYVVNATKHLPNSGENNNIEYHRIYINDTTSDEFGPFLERAADWINDKTIKADGNVFIHCHAGISRSSTVTISFMIKYLGYKSDTALLHIRKGRNIANPNSSFWKELEQMDRKYEKYGMCAL